MDIFSTFTGARNSISGRIVFLQVLLVLGVIAFFYLKWGDFYSPKVFKSDQAMSFEQRHSPRHNAIDDGWEGSPEGKAYSEFNHHLAGAAVLFIGLSELRSALGMTAFVWTRFLLPFAMLGAGSYLMIWSDHNAWPIGTMSFVGTFFGEDLLILQHKTYAILLLIVGSIELIRRVGWVHHNFFKWALPAFAVIGGLFLFFHHHGRHPSGHQIAMHHWMMGAMALTAGSCRVASEILPLPFVPLTQWRAWRPALSISWAILILLIGISLVLYSE